MTTVPLTRMDHHDPELFSELLAAVERVARTGAFTLGDEVQAFEDEFASYCEAEHAIGVSSGTEALVLALRALGIGRGDEVLVPANSFFATAEAVSLAGATPRCVDVDPATHLMTVEQVSPAIGPATRCVIPVHLYGRTVELDPILALARERGVAVIEDAAQAHGARYRGRRVGTLADAGCFSFYPAKNLGAWGDGGAVVTHDGPLADRIRLLRSHGERPRYHHQMIGTTARLDAIQAAVLRVKLRRLDGWNDARRVLAAGLADALRPSSVEVPVALGRDEDHVFHQFVVLTEERDALRAHLDDRGVASGLHYPVPIHRAPAYAGTVPVGRALPVAERLAQRLCSLPMSPWMSEAEVDAVAAAVRTHVPMRAHVT